MQLIKKISGLIWITGLSGSGKTTFSEILKRYLQDHYSINPIMLDGDGLRQVLNKEDAYSDEDRLLLARKYSQLSSMLSKQGHCVICSTISMFQDVREDNRKANKNYCEIFIDVDDDIRVKRGNAHSLMKNDILNTKSIYKLPEIPDIILSNPTIQDLDDTCGIVGNVIDNKWL